MKNKRKQYYAVEHLWRLLRAAFLLAATALWLYTDVSHHLIMVVFTLAVLVDQLHGYICHGLEKLLGIEEQHNDYE